MLVSTSSHNGVKYEVQSVDRGDTSSVLMEKEYLVFILGVCVLDELESPEEAHTKACKYIEQMF